MGLDEQQSITTADHDAAINNNMAASLCADHHLTLLSKRKRPIAADDHSSSTNRKRHKHLCKRRKKQHQSVVSSSIIAVNSNRVETPPTSDASEPPSPFVDDINVQMIKDDDDCFGNTRRPLSAPPSSTSQVSVYSRLPISTINNHASVDIPAPTSISESQQRRVTFDGVTVYYFERSQGFSCVPSFGGITLGMCERHHCTERFSITEHERRNTIMNRQRSNATKTTASNGFIDRKQQQSIVDNLSSSLVNDDTKVSINSSTIVADDQISMKDATTENVEVDNDDSTAVSDDDDDDGHSEEDEVDEDTFLQPLRGRDRRQLLRSAGVRVDRTERNECQSIRQSRQTCGCTCVGECRPDSCECALNDIKCQVDRPSFPCACSVESCANPRGRVEFNVLRVRAHYMQTMMRMRMMEQQKTLGRLIMSSQSPTHIRFEDDGSTYCMQPPPMIYHQQHSAIDSLMQRIPRLSSSSSSTSTTGSDSVFASSTSSPLASPGCLVASNPSSTICYPTKPMSLTYPSSLSTTNTTTTTNGHYSLSLNNFSSTFNNNNHYPSSNYQRNETAIGTNESRYNGTVLDQLSDEDDDEQIDEEATISDEEVFVSMNDKCQANGDHHHRRASIGIGGSMMVESPPVIIVNNDGSLPQSSNNTQSHCGSSSPSTNIIINGGASFEQRRSHHESVYVD